MSRISDIDINVQVMCRHMNQVKPYRLGDVEDHNGGLCTSVVHGSQAVVSLLSCRVPDLKLHCGVI